MDRTIYIVRHCKATGQDPDAELTAEGKVQAEALADFLEKQDVKEIVSSPFTRAVQSGTPAAGRLGLDIRTDERLKERVLASGDMPDWLEKLEESFMDSSVKLSGGESGLEAQDRAAEVIADAADGTVIVTHGNLMALMLQSADPAFGFEEWKTLSNPDVYEMKIEGALKSVRRIWNG
ncbi:histidine phosphatase family protein [Indiicoccus explosivorum]|uniref:histidine phosphatase family protein n=1 Tax=Indiicoccus explosivorum TaxID=1917864 RepID=UPI000B434B5F|nr:histidine phosphatase family protein [Indiicoccus explosivorum]